MITLPVNEFFKDFAQEEIIMPVSGSNNTRTMPIIYNTVGSLNEIGGIAFRNERPMATVMTEDVEDCTRGSLLKIDGVWMYIIDIVPDGTGITELTLSKDRIHG